MLSPDSTEEVEGDLRAPNNMEETSNIFCLLPEIWDIILQYLPSSDYLSVINSCPEWREMFKDARAGELFPLLIPILLTNDTALSNCLVDWRKISKGAKPVVDRMLTESSSPEKYWKNLTTLNYEWSPQIEDKKEMLRQYIWKLNTRSYSLDNQGQVDKLVNHFDSFEGNPFSTGYLQVSISEHGPWSHENFMEFMIKHGHHISHLSWHFQSVPTFSPDILQPFFRLLPFLPNLKTLKLSCVACMSEEFTSLFLRPDSFPKLEQLEFLDVENIVDSYTAFLTDCNGVFTFKFLQHYGHKLKTLVVNNGIFECPAMLRLIKCGHLRNLRRLRLKLEWKRSLETASELKLPYLEELQIYEDQDDQNWNKTTLQDEIFNIINNFASSLVRLQLFVSLHHLSAFERRLAKLTDEVQIHQISERGSSATPLPKLVSFSTSLCNRHSTWFWPFITLQCPNLEEVILHSLRKPSQKDVAILSKAFELGTIPKLKNISVKVTSDNPHTTPQKVEITAGGVHIVKFKRIENS